MKSRVLKSELAGRWYVDDPVQLRREVQAYIDSVNPRPVENLIGLLLPHAGYRYSGRVAAQGIKLLEGKTYKRVIVLGPSHKVALVDSVSLPDATHLETPLGQMELDVDAISNLWKRDTFQSHPDAHVGEHSVEIELPLLQEVLGDFKLIPVVCGRLSEQSAKVVAAGLLPLLDAETLLVVSSDFTHYGAGFGYVPFEDNIEQNIRSLDMGAFRLIEQKKLGEFMQYIQNTGATICGRSTIAILLALMADEAKVRLLKYDTSGNLTGDWSHCVSYLSAAISGAWKTKIEPSEPGAFQPLELSAEEQQDLLQLARWTISKHWNSRAVGPQFEISETMEKHMGAFVTLHKFGQLRGCIGEIYPRRPLIQAVTDHALNAAFKDSRFPQLRRDELQDITIEISALSPPVPVESYREIELGRHGIVLNKKRRSAVFLPQVATEQGWDLETTLEQLALKAGLASNDWKTDCEFHVFEALVFGES
jgi:AmmeMemoRadiSam system protein B/AmmeMemoRadiSam system protein A